MDTIKQPAIPLDKIPANRQLLEELRERRMLPPAAFSDALDIIHPPRSWGLWVSRLLLGFGVTLVLAGIIYFFAFNWAALPAFAKFGLVLAGFAGTVIAACLVGFERVTGQMLATASGVLVGVFLAVFGQVYQTGADAWTLFAAWAGILLPMALIVACAPLWGVFVVVANFGIMLYLDQMVKVNGHEVMLICTVLAVFNSALLAVREVLEKRVSFLAPRWTRLALLLPAGGLALLVPLDALIDWRRGMSPDTVSASAVGCTALLAGFLVFYRWVKPDMHALAAVALAACLLVECAIFRVLHETLGYDGAGLQVLALGLTSIAIFGTAVLWLRKTSRRIDINATHNMEAA